MDSKQVIGMMEAYASIYEKKGNCVDKKDKGAHNCAKKVCSEQWGEGETIFGQHAVPDENGFVSHYDVQFEHGIVENVSVEDMEVLTMEGHYKEGHHYEGEQLDEMGGVMNTVGKVVRKVIGPADQSPEAEAARMGKRRPQTKQEKGVAAGTVNNEDTDLFDIIKGHLIDEGFADTEEAAHSIMASMSEGWKQSIVEGPQSFPFKKVEKKMDKLRPGSHAQNIDRTSTRFNALGAARSAAQRREGGV